MLVFKGTAIGAVNTSTSATHPRPTTGTPPKPPGKPGPSRVPFPSRVPEVRAKPEPFSTPPRPTKPDPTPAPPAPGAGTQVTVSSDPLPGFPAPFVPDVPGVVVPTSSAPQDLPSDATVLVDDSALPASKWKLWAMVGAAAAAVGVGVLAAKRG